MAFIQLNMLYLAYLVNLNFFKRRHTKYIEILNESFNLIISYCFLLFVNLVTDRTRRNEIGYTLLLAAVIMVGLNVTFLISKVF